MTNKHTKILILAAAVLLPLSAHAQIQRVGATAAKKVLTGEASAFSNKQILHGFSKAIKDNPTYIYTPRFQQQWQTLQEVGVNLGEMPAIPKSISSEKEVRLFHNKLENAVNAALTEQKLKTISINMKPGEVSKKLIRQNRADINKYKALQYNMQSFEWGIPGINLVKIRPVNGTDFSHVTLSQLRTYVKALVEYSPKNFAEMVRFTIKNTNLDYMQKTQIIQHLSAMKEVLDIELLQLYIDRNLTLPTTANFNANIFINTTALKQFSHNEIARIVKGKNEDTIPTPEEFSSISLLASFSNEQTNAFAQSALLRRDYRLIETLVGTPDMNPSDFYDKYKLWGYTSSTKNRFNPNLKPESNAGNAAVRKVVLEGRISSWKSTHQDTQRQIEMANAQIEQAQQTGNSMLEMEAKNRRAIFDSDAARLSGFINSAEQEVKLIKREFGFNF